MTKKYGLKTSKTKRSHRTGTGRSCRSSLKTSKTKRVLAQGLCSLAERLKTSKTKRGAQHIPGLHTGELKTSKTKRDLLALGPLLLPVENKQD